MSEEQKRHLSIVNSSGFPFQLAVAAQIRAQRTAWFSILDEVPWRHPDSGRDGFIDLIAQNQAATSQRMIVECKRQRGDARWYFLDLRDNIDTLRYLGTTDDPPLLQVFDGYLDPPSAEARICIMPGEDSSRRPTLERIADELLQSVEAFALEQLAADVVPRFQYLPVVVTTARLFLCNVNEHSISLETGELPADASFNEVPIVRFRKTLWSGLVTTAGSRRSDHGYRDRERTIMVVSATGLADFLHQARFGG
jgi:hypothetical protein